MKTATPTPDLPLNTSAFRFDFPPQLLAEREQIMSEILRLMAEDTLPAIREACRMHRAWLDRYPSDYVMLDLGEPLSMLADAIEATTEAEAADEHALSVVR